MNESKWTFRVVVGLTVAIALGSIMWVSHDASAQRQRGIRVLGPQDGEYAGQRGEYAGQRGEYAGQRGEYAGQRGGYAGQQGMGFLQNRLAAIHQTLEELDLTDDQKELLTALREETRSQAEPILEDLQVKRDVLFDAVMADDPNEVAIREVAASIGSVIGDLAVIATETIEELHAILSDEQIAIVKEKLEKRKEKQQDRMKMRQDRKNQIRNFIEKIQEGADEDS